MTPTSCCRYSSNASSGVMSSSLAISSCLMSSSLAIAARRTSRLHPAPRVAKIRGVGVPATSSTKYVPGASGRRCAVGQRSRRRRRGHGHGRGRLVGWRRVVVAGRHDGDRDDGGGGGQDDRGDPAAVALRRRCARWWVRGRSLPGRVPRSPSPDRYRPRSPPPGAAAQHETVGPARGDDRCRAGPSRHSPVAP